MRSAEEETPNELGAEQQDSERQASTLVHLRILIIWFSALAALLLGGYGVYVQETMCCSVSRGQAYGSAVAFGMGVVLLAVVLQEKLAPAQKNRNLSTAGRVRS